MDVLIGSAPAIEAAMGHLRAHPGLRPPLLAATYVTHSVRRGLASGQVAMAPFDDPQAQGRMALQMVAQYLAGGVAQGRLGPPIRLIRGGDGPAVAGITLSPADYFPRIE